MKDKDFKIKYQLFRFDGSVLTICIIGVPDEESKTKQKQKNIFRGIIFKNS